MSLIWNVGGDWDFRFDTEDAGIAGNWHTKKPAKTKIIQLPHVWNAEPDWDSQTAAYYFKTFQVDAQESAKRFYIRFDSVHHFATVWVNGEQIGTHMGGYDSFDLDASAHIKIDGPNFLAVRVEKPDNRGQLDGRPLNSLPLGSVYRAAPFAGILGNVHFLMGGRAGIRAVCVFPDFEADRISIETRFWNPKNYKAELEFTLTSPDGKTGTLPKLVKLEKENSSHSITLTIDQAKVWTPETPQLYHLKVDLAGAYAFELKFGVRRVEIERCSFKINHKIRRLRGVNYQQAYPFYAAIPPAGHDIRKELSLIMDSGFNCIRSAGVPLSNEVLDICDEIGLLVIQETNCYDQKSSREGLQELKDHILSLFLSTGHHPCIIAWAIGANNGSMVLENGNKLLRYACEIDPYRPILSNLNSVYMDGQGNGKIDLGKVYNPTFTKIEQYESHKLKISVPVPGATQHLLSKYCSSKDAKHINDNIHGSKSFWERYNYLKEELGGKVLVDGIGQNVPENIEQLCASPALRNFSNHSEVKELKSFKKQIDKELGKIGLWKTTGDFLAEASKIGYAGMGRQVESLLINSQISGYFFENWADHQNRFSGLVDWFRQPKAALEFAKNVNKRAIIISEAEVRSPYMGTSAAININLLNEGVLDEFSLLIRVKGPNGRIWHQESMPGKAKQGINSIGRFKFPVGMEKGWFTFDLTLFQGKKEVDKKEEVFIVPPQVELEPLIKKISFIGPFPETVSYASDKTSSLIALNDISSLEDGQLLSIFKKVKAGAVLLMGALSFDDAARLNRLGVLPFKLTCFHASSNNSSGFHFISKHEFFKDLPSGCLIDLPYADIMPIVSLEPISGAEVICGSISLNGQKPGSAKVKTGEDVSVVPLDKGTLVINQFRFFDILGKNALADALFFNIMSELKKKTKKS